MSSKLRQFELHSKRKVLFIFRFTRFFKVSTSGLVASIYVLYYLFDNLIILNVIIKIKKQVKKQ